MATASDALEFHPVADIFPMMSEEEFAGLTADILAHGLLEPIWLHEGRIIDGRNRYRACLEIGIEADFRKWSGEGSLLEFIVSLNLHRRHLNESQRGMVGAKIKQQFEAEAKKRQAHGQTAPGKTLQANLPEAFNGGQSRDQAAALVNVSPRTIEAASKVRANGTPELARAVESGHVKVSAAAAVANLPKPAQAALVDEGPAAVRAKAAEIRREKAAPTPAPLPGQASFLPPEPPKLAPRTKPARDPLDVVLDELFCVLASVDAAEGQFSEGWGGFERVIRKRPPKKRQDVRNQLQHIVERLEGWIEIVRQIEGEN